MMAVHTQQMLTVGAVLVLAGVCAMARPSGPEVPRETRAASGFKLSTGVNVQGYDDKQANSERKIPVHVIYPDGKQEEPSGQISEEVHASPPVVQNSNTKPEDRKDVPVGRSKTNVNREKESTYVHSNSEHDQNSTSLDDNKSQNLQENEKVSQELESSSEGKQSDREGKQYRQFDKSKTRESYKKLGIESSEKAVSSQTDNKFIRDNTALKDTEQLKREILTPSEDNKAESVSTGRIFNYNNNNRQWINTFENPILTYLSQQPQADRINNNLNFPSRNGDSKPHNVRREVFHQQTIINPNPYLQQFLQQNQQSYPLYNQMQYPQQQQQYGFSNVQHFSYPPFSINPQSVGFVQRQEQVNPPLQDYPKNPDSNRAEIQQELQPSGKPDNYVTTLTLYPAIASVMYTTPATGISSTSGVVPSSTTYPQQTNLQYPQPSGQSSFPIPNSPVNPQNTRFFMNGPTHSSRLSWPLASYFPIMIHDPVLGMMNAFTSLIEYGPEADVCKTAKHSRQGRSKDVPPGDVGFTAKTDRELQGKVVSMENIGWQEVGKDGSTLVLARKMPANTENEEEVEDEKEESDEEGRKKKGGKEETEIVMESGGNGNAGPYITRLLVRKGGVSIAGPGGIATAGSGGTAIVGPGGVAYTSPNGLAVVGPGGKVVGFPSGTDLSVIASQVASPNTSSEGSSPRLISIPPGGRIVATGPIVYYHQPQ